ncbi:hypothetical protein KIN20_011663 [Parelaphostrongylus tenuis]|uniref:Serine-threonine/tyrosine-protein kinase catalytic domain-containing protein n=1 Tax=Parelaphostrongylus tenuis TaxID=148309 RepID=A0AAD5MTY1_PARTN|nr:hypothetical protein KIN20_011663 [Parelaphostrongylus tenuis]
MPEGQPDKPALAPNVFDKEKEKLHGHILTPLSISSINGVIFSDLLSTCFDFEWRLKSVILDYQDWALTERKLAVRWVAPETISTFTFMLKTDVYSYAMMVYETFTSGIEVWDGLFQCTSEKAVLVINSSLDQKDTKKQEGVFAETSPTSNQENPSTEKNGNRSEKKDSNLVKLEIKPDVAGGAYTKEAEEADREADDHFVDREAARGQEDYDRAAAEKSSDPGSDALFHRATLGDNL